MSAPVLTEFQQKLALSNKKKKKKKAPKTFLGIPVNLKEESYAIDRKKAAKLRGILFRLLPPARLPCQKKIKSSKYSAEENIQDSDVHQKAKIIRNQLYLGVNAVNKSIKKELVSAVLLASDIHPKLLINNLNLLCNHYKIPFLYMPDLRKITKSALGFPCIAVGFQKDATTFTEAVAEIKLLFENDKIDLKNETQDAEAGDGECKDKTQVNCPGTDEKFSKIKTKKAEPEDNKSEVEVAVNTVNPDSHEKVFEIKTKNAEAEGGDSEHKVINASCPESETESDESEPEVLDNAKPPKSEVPFTYLYRSSVRERVFVPVNDVPGNLPVQTANSNFIPIQMNVDEPKELKCPVMGISYQSIKKQMKAQKLDDDNGLGSPESKKQKKGKNSNSAKKQNVQYSPANVLKIPSNPDRDSKKKK